MAASSRHTARVQKARSVSRKTETAKLPAAALAWRTARKDSIRNPGKCRQDRTRNRAMDTKGTGNGRDASRQKVVRFQQRNQFRGPFPSLRHLSGISEGERLPRIVQRQIAFRTVRRWRHDRRMICCALALVPKRST